MFCLNPVDILMYGVQAKFIARLKVYTKWVHIIPMTRCFFQSRKVSVQKNTKYHKGCDWLTSKKYYGSTSTTKLRLINYSFDTPTNNDDDEDNDSQPLHQSPVMPMMQARAGAGAQVIAVAV